MAKITFITPQQDRIEVEASDGTLMQAAVANAVSGIDADCGGACACATCHVKPATEWRDRLGEPGEIEATLLEFEDGADETSRLSCQVKVTEALNGLVVQVVGR